MPASTMRVERPRVGEQHGDEHEGEHEVDRREQGLSGEEAADRLELPHSRDRLSGRPGLEIGDRKAQEMGEQPLPQFDVDPVGRVRERIGAQVLQRHVEQADEDEAADEHEQRLVAAMGQDLVDDNLEEQRRRQGENLHEQRRRQHVAERTAIAPDGRQEPAHAEQPRIDASAADPAGDQQRLPADLARDALERRLAGGVADRIDEPAQPRRVAPGENDERAIGHSHDCRSGQRSQPFGGHLADQPRFEPDNPGGANEVGFVGRALAKREFARELHRVGADAVIGGDAAQGAQPRVERRRLPHRWRSLHHRRFTPRPRVALGRNRTQ